LHSSGLVGKSWAMLFAAASFQVSIYDLDQSKLKNDLKEISNKLNDLQTKGILKGKLSAQEQMSLITGYSLIEACLKDAIYCQVITY
jgi:lambda-crystallin homolog